MIDRVAVVSGGSRGIGAAISVCLKQSGYRVAATYATHDAEATAFKEKTGIAIYRWDVTDYEACALGLKKISDDLGPVDILVNNAGITRDAMFHKMTAQQWHEVINTNLNALFNMCQPVWNAMRARAFGRIICISSINGQKGQVGQTNYSAAKAGELGFIKALAQEGASKGITVNAICPGYVATDMLKMIDTEILEKRILPHIPIGRLGEPKEIANCVKFLVGEEAGYITGATFSINGGQYMV